VHAWLSVEHLLDDRSHSRRRAECTASTPKHHNQTVQHPYVASTSPATYVHTSEFGRFSGMAVCCNIAGDADSSRWGANEDGKRGGGGGGSQDSEEEDRAAYLRRPPHDRGL
jgi:hypothetical protein